MKYLSKKAANPGVGSEVALPVPFGSVFQVFVSGVCAHESWKCISFCSSSIKFYTSILLLMRNISYSAMAHIRVERSGQYIKSDYHVYFQAL